jgi:hypothetical protein
MGTDNELETMKNVIDENEKLHEIAYNTSQEYLSWLMTINSDYTNRMLMFFNIVTIASLGLSIATAIIQTPIEIRIAIMAIGITAVIGMIYTGIYRVLYYRKKKRLNFLSKNQ